MTNQLARRVIGEAGARNHEKDVQMERIGLALRLRRTSLAMPMQDNSGRAANPRRRENVGASWCVMPTREILATARARRVDATNDAEGWRMPRS
eukprot:7332664-Pyramimonas_sp.AAC.1